MNKFMIFAFLFFSVQCLWARPDAFVDSVMVNEVIKILQGQSRKLLTNAHQFDIEIAVIQNKVLQFGFVFGRIYEENQMLVEADCGLSSQEYFYHVTIAELRSFLRQHGQSI